MNPEVEIILSMTGNGADIILHDEGSSAVIYNTEQIQLLQSSSHNAYVVATAGGVRTVDAILLPTE